MRYVLSCLIYDPKYVFSWCWQVTYTFYWFIVCFTWCSNLCGSSITATVFLYLNNSLQVSEFESSKCIHTCSYGPRVTTLYPHHCCSCIAGHILRRGCRWLQRMWQVEFHPTWHPTEVWISRRWSGICHNCSCSCLSERHFLALKKTKINFRSSYYLQHAYSVTSWTCFSAVHPGILHSEGYTLGGVRFVIKKKVGVVSHRPR